MLDTRNPAPTEHGSMSRQAAAADTTAPVLTSWPQDGQGAEAPLVFVFSEAIKLGAGTITLRPNSGGSAYTETLLGSPYVTVSGNTISFDPPQRLAYATSYSIEISPNAVTDLAGNPANSGGQLYAYFTSGLSPVALHLTGTSGADTFHGSDLADTMDGLGGDDTLNGYGGDDILNGGDEPVQQYYTPGDRINGGAGNDTLHGNGGNDWLWGGDGNDRIYGDADNDNLHGEAGDDLLDGGAGNDSLNGGSGANTLIGGEGDDSLSADSGSSGLLDGGNGNDRLSGDGGVDYDGGAGNDEITLRLSSVDGRAATVRGGDGADIIRFSQHSFAQAAATISGGAGVDTFAFESFGLGGKVALTITDFAPGAGGDVLDLLALYVIQGVGNPFDRGQLRLLASGADTLLQVRDSADPALYITLVSLAKVQPAQLTSANFTGGIDPLGGNTGLTLTGTNSADTLRGMLLDDTLLGLDGADSLYGEGGNDLLDGGAGDDTLDGGSGDNTLRGGDGNDILRSTSTGTSVLDGGLGNDRISGGAGNDTLRGGAGNDELSFESYGGAARTVSLAGDDGADILRFGYGYGQVTVLASGGAGDDSFVVNDYNNLTITDFAAGDKLDLRNLIADRNISGNPFGALGYMKAVQEGSQVRIYVDADGAAGANAAWRLAIALDNTVLAALTSASFAGGFDPTGSTQGLNLTGTPGNDILNGEALNDTINGGDGNDTIDGGGGDDQLYGGDESVIGGGDRISGGAGDDMLRGGTGSDYLDGGLGNDLLFGDAGDDQLTGGAGNDRLEGGDGRDNLSDNEGSDYLSGGAGDDVLNSSWSYQDVAAATTLDGGAGNDSMNAGLPVRTVLGGAGNDELTIDAISTPANTAAMTVDMGEGNDKVRINNQYSDARAVRITGGAGSDTYTFNSGERWPLVTITDFQGGAGGDVLELFSFSYSLLPGNPFGAAGHARLVQDGSRVLFQFDVDGAAGPKDMATRIVFENMSVASFTADNFTDGARPDGAATGLTLAGTPGNDTLQGGRLDDTLRGNGGNDILYGNAGADLLQGEDGNDNLYSGDGADRLEGGAGADYLDGEDGDDELLGGAGNDILSDSRGNNILRGGDGDDSIDSSSNGRNQLFGEAGNDLLTSTRGNNVLDGGTGDDRLVVSGAWYDDAARNVEARGGEGRDTLVTLFGSEGAASTVLLTGGSGADVFAPASVSYASSVTVTDFATGAGGDLLDIAAIAVPTAGNPFAADGTVRLVQRGADTVVQARDSTLESAIWQDALVLRNVSKDVLGPQHFLHGFNPNGSSTGLALAGSTGADMLSGGWLDDTLNGGGGNDILTGSMGNDRLNGGDGDDILDGDKSDLLPGARNGGSWQATRTGDDILDGGAGNDTLVSAMGSDTLLGGAGNDLLSLAARVWYAQGQTIDRVVLDGGDGNDRIQVLNSVVPSTVVTMSGGAGTDSFELAVAYAGAWTITDFQAGAGGDVLDVFSSLGWTRQSPFANGNLRFEQRGADTVLQYDVDGPGSTMAFADVLTLKNVDKSALTADNMRYGYAPDGTPLALGPVVQGGSGNDRLQGDAASNQLQGGAGNDVLIGGGGNDFLHGGDGADSAVFGSKRDQYEVRDWQSGEVWVSDLRAGLHDGKDRLLQVERLVFADVALALDTGFDETAGQAYRIYRAAFDRAPDQAGLGFWIAMMDGGTLLRDIAGGFVRSQEFTALYGAAPTNAEIVTRMYRNILDRDPEQAGYDYWLNALDKKVVALPEMLAMFSESNENRWAVAELIANGVAYQPFGG
ncbi:DUF4214 domain-containing protein [Massilia yuzhufengensis]|uniref:Type I secretion C-terminal target domain (VC_A0849 subclass) n=1 Tax=Massilia yuzhufengensis TaxID=1164594 RepID=A0A1I1UDL6_9BURK|nr:DUF4214 domain-containing protein [Massilia yuzhufengensis]SFD68936.1 type I secretion C-terminal target domain (VC_A0849 subclass) [Massilia yuzhufengensis]